MCGIAGLISLAGRAIPPEKIRAMNQAILHRGPDDRGFFAWSPDGRTRLTREPSALEPSTVFLGHQRLKIIDLSEGGWQPMQSEDGRYTIVFNGEIYNFIELRKELESSGHRFRSQSDTEVLLRAYLAWGPEAVPRLVGMFAFVIFDRELKRFFSARDFFGIKPFYYAFHREQFIFCSELKGIRSAAPELSKLNPTAVGEYLRFTKSDAGGRTLIEGIHQLPPAHFMTTSLDGRNEMQRYWEPRLGDDPHVSFAQAAEKVRASFVKSVGFHMRADVPVGACLSGGIDSSAIVGAMRALGGKSLDIPTFSYIADSEQISEKKWITIAETECGTSPHHVSPNLAESHSDLDGLIAGQDEPFASTSIFAQHHVFRAVKAAGIKVTLEGQGADELLGGYPGYLGDRIVSMIRGFRWLQAVGFTKRASRTRDIPVSNLMRFAAGSGLPHAIQAPMRAFSSHTIYPAWLNKAWFEERDVVLKSLQMTRSADALKEHLCRSLVETTIPRLLRYGDRNSMMNSIETRVPFLIPEFVDLIFSLPEEYLIAPDGTSKHVFREAMKGILPEPIRQRRDKVGFDTTEVSWLRALDGWAQDLWSRFEGDQAPFLDLALTRASWNEMLGGKPVNSEHMWRILNLLRWMELNQLSA